MGKPQNKPIEIILSILFTVALCLCVLSFSIGLPIYLRPFYYGQIDSLNLAAESGFSRAEIKQAYNEVLDYLTLPGKEFSAGEMRFTAEAKAHFADCKLLFNFNITVFFVLIAIVAALSLLKISGKIKMRRFKKRSPLFWAGIITLVLPTVVGALAALNFERAFIVFHHIFFPGKDNWIFDPVTDEIINILPPQFFINCGILIGSSVLLISALLIVLEFLTLPRKKERA